MHDDLCRIIRDYFQPFGKGWWIIRRAEFLEEVQYLLNFLLGNGQQLTFRQNYNCDILQVYKISLEETAISSLENSVVTRLVVKDIA